MQKRSKEELNLLTKVELMKLAKSLGLSGFTTFRKDQIIEMISNSEKLSHKETVKTKEKGTELEPCAVEDALSEKTPLSSKDSDKKTDLTVSQKSDGLATLKSNKKEDIDEKVTNGLAIQHPSASPSALRYGRYTHSTPEPRDSAFRPAIWPDKDVIPDRYGKDKLITLIRDPFHLVCFWELSGSRLSNLASSIEVDLWQSRRMVLRIFKETVGLPVLVGTTDVYGEVGRFHVKVPEPGVSYFAEIGFYFYNGRYETVLTDRSCRTPQTRPPRVGPVSWLSVIPSRARRVISLETQPVSHPSPQLRTLRRGVKNAVSKRRNEFGISSKPTTTGSEQLIERNEDQVSNMLDTLKSGKN